jgi:mRNA interferase HigB
VRVISKRTLREFWEKHADAETSLNAWYAVASKATWTTFADVRQAFNSADVIHDNVTVFNIGGNKYRLVVDIDYRFQKIYIWHVLTHTQYDKDDWDR